MYIITEKSIRMDCRRVESHKVDDHKMCCNTVDCHVVGKAKIRQGVVTVALDRSVVGNNGLRVIIV